MLSTEYLARLEQYIKENKIPEHTAKKLRKGADGDVYFLIERQMPLIKVINCIEANTKTTQEIAEFNKKESEKKLKIY